jgi:flagellar biosynthesis/type III secretory pathway protein FliH
MALSFSIPKDYNVPSGVKEGVEFSDIATFKFEGDKMMLLTIGEDNTPVLNRDAKEEKPKGAKEAVKERLAAMEDEEMAAEMGAEAGAEAGAEEAYAEGEEE